MIYDEIKDIRFQSSRMGAFLLGQTMNILRIEGLTPEGFEGRIVDAETGEPVDNVKSVTATWERGQLFPIVSVEFELQEADQEWTEIDNGWLAVDTPPLDMVLERIE